MSNPSISEIASHLQHNDHSLAVRRMLDLSLDAGDPRLLRETINWSREYHKDLAHDLLPVDFLTRAHELLNKLATITYSSRGDSTPLIAAEKISKTYAAGNFSLKSLSLQVKTGEIVGVVGENGNGKTTLLRCLSGQLALTSGHVTYHLLQKPDRYDVRKYVAFIPQRIPRWWGKLKDNLHFSASISGITGEQNELMVDFMLERLNLSAYAELGWTQISSGYRTRFEIARILLQRPRLLILDEPLANLDINAQQTILTDLRFMAKGSHNPMGLLLSSQQLHEIEKIADTILFIKRGECLYQSNTSAPISTEFVIEVETVANRETILAILGNERVNIHYNGGFYTISSASYQPQEMLGQLLGQQIPVSYFRDITHSTKRFF